MPLSPQRMGFMPIRNNGRSDSGGEGDIPLTNVPTASSTGARKHAQTAVDMSTSTTNTSEKKGGLFHRKSKSEKEEGGIIGRRKAVKKLGDDGRKGTWGDEAGLNAMGRLYYKIIGFSSVTRYLFYVAPVALLLAVPLIILPITGHLNDTFVGGKSTDLDRPRLFDLFLWIEVSWLSLWGGKIVAGLLPAVFMFFCGVVSSGTRKYATCIKNLEIPISLLLWALASWLVFRFKFQDDNYQWVSIMTKILASLFVSSCVLLGEKFIIQLISISYHQRSFANRIRDSKREIFLLGLMYDASRTLFPMYCEEFAEEDYCINDSIEAMLMGGKKKRRGFHKKSGSLTPNVINPTKLVGEVGRFGDKITSVFGNIASEITGKQVFNPNSAHSIVIEALEKTRSSEALARRIWMSFVVEGNESLYVDDVAEVLGPGHQEEAEECFAAVDADENGDISLDEMVRKVVEIGKERKAITNSMKDIGQALKVLDSILLFIVLVIVVIIFLSFFQSSFVTTLAGAGTALISLSFAISTTCQEFLGSIIFLFVKHPYDVGDRIEVSSESLTVEKISLLYTVFTSLKGMQVTQVPNIVLNSLWIDNLSRSKAMKELVEVNVSYDTSFEDVELLRLEMEKFVRHPDNSRDFQQDLVIGIGGVGDCDKLTLKIAIKHKSNWHNEAVRATRRSKFMCALALALKKVPIFGPGAGAPVLGSFDNPTYSVAVEDEFAVRAREKAAQEADAARMVPLLKPKRSNTSTTGHVQHVSEKQAVQELNTRPPLEGLDSNYGYPRDDDGNLDAGNRGSSPTLDPRDGSQERRRTENIEQIRADLVKRHSTRGRRKAGEGVPSAPLGQAQPGLSVTQYDRDGNAIVTSNRQFSYDVLQPGAQSASSHGSPYVGGVDGGYGLLPAQTQVSPGVAEAARESYNLYEGAARYTSPPASGGKPTVYGRELTPNVPAASYGAGRGDGSMLGPTPGSYGPELSGSSVAAGAGAGTSGAVAPHGARPRGASVSRTIEERENERRQAGQGTKKQYTK